MFDSRQKALAFRDELVAELDAVLEDALSRGEEASRALQDRLFRGYR